jgi:deoxyribodipyrimidine photo-lyase
MDPAYESVLLWYRRDLRVADHAALYHALQSAQRVHCVFVFDTAILQALPRRDRRVEFILGAAAALDEKLRALGGPGCGLIALHGDAAQELPRIAAGLRVQAVFANHDDEPAALQRDALVRVRLRAAGVAMHTFKDHVVFERSEVLTQAGAPYSVFTPYSGAWLARLDDFYLKAYPVERYAQRLAPRPEAWRQPLPSLHALDFEPTDLRAAISAYGARSSRRNAECAKVSQRTQRDSHKKIVFSAHSAQPLRTLRSSSSLEREPQKSGPKAASWLRAQRTAVRP